MKLARPLFAALTLVSLAACDTPPPTQAHPLARDLLLSAPDSTTVPSDTLGTGSNPDDGDPSDGGGERGGHFGSGG